MKKHNIILYALLLLSTAITMASVFSKRRPGNEKLKYVYTKQENKENNLNKVKANFWDIYTTLLIPAENKAVNPNIVLKDTTLKEVKLSEVKKFDEIIVFRYSSKDCEECVESVLKVINDYFKNIPMGKIIIINDAYSERDFVLKTRFSKIKLPVYMLTETLKGLDLPIENKNLPFLFVYNKENKAIKLFTPFRDIPQKTGEYLKITLAHIK